MTSIFVISGDLNIRDEEVATVRKRLGTDNTLLLDAWEEIGRPPDGARTWTLYNDPKILKNIYRFDRVFFTGVKGCNVESLRLIGREILPPPVSSPASDHFGIFAEFSFDSHIEKSLTRQERIAHQLTALERRNSASSSVSDNTSSYAPSFSNSTLNVPSATALDSTRSAGNLFDRADSKRKREDDTDTDIIEIIESDEEEDHRGSRSTIIECPMGYDATVFSALPRSIQLEIISSARL